MIASKKHSLLKEKYSMAHTVLVCVLMMLVIMLPAMLRHHGIFLVRGDYVDQYLTRLIKAKTVLSGGAGTWDWYNFLGASYNKIDVLFTLNSVCLLFPVNAIPYVVTYMHLIRIALIAICAYAYFDYMVKEKRTAFFATILYTFSSYTFMCFEFMQFLEALWTFPFILLAAEKIFRAKHYKHQLILAAFLSCTISFYFFIFSTLSFSVYFLCRFFLSEEWREKRKAKFFILAVAEYVIGFLCAYFVFSHFLYRMFNSSGSSDTLGTTLQPISYFIDSGSVARLFSFFVPAASNRFNAFGNSAWATHTTYIPVFGMAFVCAFLAKKSDKKWLKTLTICSFALILIPAICLIYNLFSSHYTRYGYTVILFLVLATVTFLEDYDGKLAKKWTIRTTVCLAVLFCVYYAVLFSLGNKYDFVYFLHGPKHEADADRYYRIYTLLTSAGFYLCLFAVVYSEKIRKHMLPIVIAAITVYGCSYTAVNQNDAYLLNYYPESNITLKEQVDGYFFRVPAAEDARDYRIDFTRQWRNYAYTMQKPSISVFESMRNRHAISIAKNLGFYDDRVHVFPTTQENSTRTLFGVKYYYNAGPRDNIAVPDGFSYYKTDKGIDIYKNDFFMGMGFTYDSYMLRSEYEAQREDGVNYASLLLDTLVVEDQDVDFVKDILKPYTPEHTCENRISVESFEMNSGGFTATVTTEQEEILYLAVPHEAQGWHATINGKETEFIQANLGMIAIKTEKGENRIEFVYKSPARTFGIAVSAFGLLLLLAYLVICKKTKLWK